MIETPFGSDGQDVREKDFPVEPIETEVSARFSNLMRWPRDGEDPRDTPSIPLEHASPPSPGIDEKARLVREGLKRSDREVREALPFANELIPYEFLRNIPTYQIRCAEREERQKRNVLTRRLELLVQTANWGKNRPQDNQVRSAMFQTLRILSGDPRSNPGVTVLDAIQEPQYSRYGRQESVPLTRDIVKAAVIASFAMGRFEEAFQIISASEKRTMDAVEGGKILREDVFRELLQRTDPTSRTGPECVIAIARRFSDFPEMEFDSVVVRATRSAQGDTISEGSSREILLRWARSNIENSQREAQQAWYERQVPWGDDRRSSVPVSVDNAGSFVSKALDSGLTRVDLENQVKELAEASVFSDAVRLITAELSARLNPELRFSIQVNRKIEGDRLPIRGMMGKGFFNPKDVTYDDFYRGGEVDMTRSSRRQSLSDKVKEYIGREGERISSLVRGDEPYFDANLILSLVANPEATTQRLQSVLDSSLWSMDTDLAHRTTIEPLARSLIPALKYLVVVCESDRFRRILEEELGFASGKLDLRNLHTAGQLLIDLLNNFAPQGKRSPGHEYQNSLANTGQTELDRNHVRALGDSLDAEVSVRTQKSLAVATEFLQEMLQQLGSQEQEIMAGLQAQFSQELEVADNQAESGEEDPLSRVGSVLASQASEKEAEILRLTETLQEKESGLSSLRYGLSRLDSAGLLPKVANLITGEINQKRADSKDKIEAIRAEIVQTHVAESSARAKLEEIRGREQELSEVRARIEPIRNQMNGVGSLLPEND